MACNSFLDCINDPISENNLPAQNTFETLGTTATFSINLVLYILYSLLIISVVWFMFKGIFAIIGADSSESFEKFRGAITNAVFAAVGIVLIVSAKFIFIVVLGWIGIPEAENIFSDGPLKVLFGI